MNSGTELHYSVPEFMTFLHFDFIAKWEEGKLHQLEVLHSEGYADYCNAE